VVRYGSIVKGKRNSYVGEWKRYECMLHIIIVVLSFIWMYHVLLLWHGLRGLNRYLIEQYTRATGPISAPNISLRYVIWDVLTVTPKVSDSWCFSLRWLS
jgi:hypothetical protein